MITAIETAAPDVAGTLPKAQLEDNGAFRNFAIVWALATLFHMAHSGVFDTRLNLAMLTIAALYVIFKPSMAGFIALVLLQLLDVAFGMPNVTNHWLFTAFVNIAILQAILYCVYRKKTFAINDMEVYNTFAPPARVMLIILYAWAVFHKLNSGFFSPDVSCAAELLRAQHLDPVLSSFPQILTFNAYFTIVVELGILIMFCFNKTRHAAILIGFLFHLALSYSSYNAFFDFTSMVTAAYFLFASNDFHRRADQWRRDARLPIKSYLRTFSTSKLIIVCVSIIIVLAFLSVLNRKLNSFKLFHLYFFWTLYGVIITYLFVRFLFVKREGIRNPFALRSKSFIIVPVIALLNGASPYLGLKTENSYSMFSNLRTEGGISNHYLVPASLQMFNYQSDLVEIVSSDDVKLQRLADEHQLMVLFEFRRYLQKHDVGEVVYRLNGNLEVFRTGETGLTGVLQPDFFLLSRLMAFRTVSKYEPQPCAH